MRQEASNNALEPTAPAGLQPKASVRLCMAWGQWVRAVAATVALVLSFPCWAQSAGEEAELRALLSFLQDPQQGVPDVSRQSCAARLVGYALLYRQEPDKYRNAFFAELVVDDYAERADGQYNFVEPDQIATTISSASALPAGITDQRLAAATGFCALKQKNLWVATQKAGRLSLARFLRGAVLASLLEGTDEDPVGIANAIDAYTANQSSAPP